MSGFVPAQTRGGPLALRLAWRELRKLPAVVSELSDRAVASLKIANEAAGSTATTDSNIPTTDETAIPRNSRTICRKMAWQHLQMHL